MTEQMFPKQQPPTWEQQLLDDLAPIWTPPPTGRVHLAIMCEPYMSRVANGTKRVESRWSMNRCAPFGHINAEDTILFKLTGGPVMGVASVDRRWCVELEGPQHVRSVLREHWLDLGVEESFIEKVTGKKFATLARVLDYRPLDAKHIRCGKVDKRGWVVLRGGAR